MPTVFDSTCPASVIDLMAHQKTDSPALRTGLLAVLSQPPRRFYLTTLLVAVWAGVLLAMAPMLGVMLPTPWAENFHRPEIVFYTFQVPLLVAFSGILGRAWGTLAIGIYLTVGYMGWPLFAGGGGPAYLTQPQTGYLIGFLFVPLVLQRLVAHAYRGAGWFRGRLPWLMMASIAGVGTIYLCGLAGLATLVFTGHLALEEAWQWFMQLTWPVILYDVLFAGVVLALVRLLRLFLWFTLY
jgi:biotin transport system substrate-specific component